MVTGRHCAAVLIAMLAVSRTPASAELPGELDPTFNGGQPRVLDLARSVPRATYFQAVTVDDQGRALVGGTAFDEDGRYAVALVRLAADGSLDPSFATNGSTVLQLGLGTGAFAPSSRAQAIGPRPGGAGWLIAGSATASDARGAALMAAFDPNGMLDIGYGNGGSVRAQPGGPTDATLAEDGAIGPDGATYVASTVSDAVSTANRRLAVSKVLVDGALATGFGNVPLQGAYVGTFSEGADTSSYGIGVAVAGSNILVVGTTGDATSAQQLLVLRLTMSGMLDPSFGAGTGVFRRQVADAAAQSRFSQGYEIARGPNGEIYAAGLASDGDGRAAIAVTRLAANGTLDSTFGSGGTRRVQPATDPNPYPIVVEVLVQPDGRILVVSANNGPDTSIVLRLDTSGDLDPSFGTNGIVHLQFGSQTFVGGAVLSPDAQSVVIVGSTEIDSISQGFIAKMLLVPFTPTTTTTTLPGGGCASAPSLPGARCRIGGLVASIDGLLPSGKLRTRLDRTLGRSDSALAAAESASGKSLRRKLKRGLAQMRRLGRQLGSKAAQRAIGTDARTAFVGQVESLVGELSTLIPARP